MEVLWEGEFGVGCGTGVEGVRVIVEGREGSGVLCEVGLGGSVEGFAGGRFVYASEFAVDAGYGGPASAPDVAPEGLGEGGVASD